MSLFAGAAKNDPRRNAFNESWVQLKERRKLKREQQDADYDKHVQRMKELLEQFASLLPQAAADGAQVSTGTQTTSPTMARYAQGSGAAFCPLKV